MQTIDKIRCGFNENFYLVGGNNCFVHGVPHCVWITAQVVADMCIQSLPKKINVLVHSTRHTRLQAFLPIFAKLRKISYLNSEVSLKFILRVLRQILLFQLKVQKFKQTKGFHHKLKIVFITPAHNSRIGKILEN